MFVLPGALVMLVLVGAYAYWGTLPAIQDAFDGIKAVVVIVVASAVLKLSAKTLKSNMKIAVAAVSFTRIFLFNVPFPYLIAAAAIFGAFQTAAPNAPPLQTELSASPLRAAVICAFLWAAPIGILVAFGPPLFAEVAVFFSKLAVVTFGDAYAVLTYMTQAMVNDFA